MDPSVLDNVISRLLYVEESKPGKQVELSEPEIRKLCSVAKEIFMEQPNLLETWRRRSKSSIAEEIEKIPAIVMTRLGSWRWRRRNDDEGLELIGKRSRRRCGSCGSLAFSEVDRPANCNGTVKSKTCQDN